MAVTIELVHNDLLTQPQGERRRRVLVYTATYLPGSKDGGPVRSLANQVLHLSPYFDFYIVTRDRDTGDKATYPGVTPNQWHRVGAAHVMYCSSIGPAMLRRAFRESKPDLVILNSFLCALTRVAVLLRRFGAFGKTPTLLAPQGEFSAGALAIKPLKKIVYRNCAKLLGLHDRLLWQASTPIEKREILQAAPALRLDPNSIYIACDIHDDVDASGPHVSKEPGSVKLVFISRVNAKKNLHYLLERLCEVRGEVRLDIYGPVAEKDVPYWERCKAVITRLSTNVIVEFKGEVDHAAVPQVLRDHHFFALSTTGENFCHAAVEALVNGTPALLSDETPWTGLKEARAGFDIPLKDTRGWVEALEDCVDMNQETYETYLKGTLAYGRRFSVEETVRQQVAMIESVLDSCTVSNG